MIKEEILTFDNLYWSSQKCAKSVSWKKSTQFYILNGLEETFKLYCELSNGLYTERPHKIFKIYEPKERDVLSIAFRDRVYQRVLNDYCLYPVMTENFIEMNCACQKNKGTDFARNNLLKYLRRFYQRNKSNEGYIIHLDVKGYYPNMQHKLAEDLFKEKLPSDIYPLVERAMKVYKEDKGYFPGSQMIQILGISLLNKLDHYIKEKLRIREYIRYMDDLILIVKDNPQYYIDEIAKKLSELNFEPNKEKTKAYKLHRGCVFLGFKYYLTRTGKALMILSTKNIKRRRHKLYKLAEKATLEEFINSYQTWRSYAARSYAKNILVDTDKLFLILKETYYDTKNKN